MIVRIGQRVVLKNGDTGEVVQEGDLTCLVMTSQGVIKVEYRNVEAGVADPIDDKTMAALEEHALKIGDDVFSPMVLSLIARVKQEQRQRQEAIRKYGRHLPQCRVLYWTRRGADPTHLDAGICVCGLRELQGVAGE